MVLLVFLRITAINALVSAIITSWFSSTPKSLLNPEIVNRSIIFCGIIFDYITTIKSPKQGFYSCDIILQLPQSHIYSLYDWEVLVSLSMQVPGMQVFSF